MPSPEIQTLGAAPPALERLDWVKGRIFDVVTRGVRKCMVFRGEDPWEHRPGLMPWWLVRQVVGGKVSREQFIEAVDSLLAEGRLIEVRLIRRDRRDAPHLLVQPGKFKELPRSVAQARGLADVLKKEPWARAIGSGAGRAV